MLKLIMDSLFWRLLCKLLSNTDIRIIGKREHCLADLEFIKQQLEIIIDDSVFVAFVCNDKSSLSSWFIRKISGHTYSHCGLLLNSNDAYHVTQDGMKRANLASIIGDSDDFSIVVFNYKTKSDREEMLARLLKFSHVDYDYTQTIGGEKLYCSELIFRCLHGIVKQELKTSRILGKEIFTPGDVFESGKILYRNFSWSGNK
jgi:hypothetical protein